VWVWCVFMASNLKVVHVVKVVNVVKLFLCWDDRGASGRAAIRVLT